MTKRKPKEQNPTSRGPAARATSASRTKGAAGFSPRDPSTTQERISTHSGTTDRWATALFLILLVIVGLRPLIQETHDTERQPFAAVLPGLPEVGPLPTLWINLIIMGIFGWTLALRLQGRLPRPRRTGLMLGFVVIAVAAAASCFVASNKRLGINTTLDWITLPMLGIALVHLLQHAWQMRLTLCVIVASGAASAAESIDQAYVTLPQTVEMYEQNKDEFWRGQGVAADSYQIRLFEKRVYEQAANGFFALANVAGSYFVLTLFAALALAVAGRPNKSLSQDLSTRGSARAQASGSLSSGIGCKMHAVLIMLLAIPMLGALWFTKSRGAIVALVIGLFFLGVLYVLRDYIRANRRKAFLLGWMVVVAGLAGVTGFGLAKGYLPGGSLTYRWWYLETTAKMVADHPLLGVGSGQYGRYYPRYKDIKSPEEISNPHNFLAQAAAEWGIGGLVGMVLMLVGGSRIVAGLRIADCGSRIAEGSRTPHGSEEHIPGPLLSGAVLLISIWLLKVWISGNSDFNYIYGHLTLPILGWLAAFAICAATLSKIGFGPGFRGIARAEARGSLSPDTGPRRSARDGDDAYRLHPAGILGAGLFAFLVHNLITFSLFIPGSAMTFFALLAVCIAMRSEQTVPVGSAHPTCSAPVHRRASAKSKGSLLMTAAGFFTMIVVTFVYVYGIRPVATCWQILQEARSAETPRERVGEEYFIATAADPLDPTPAKEWGQFYAAYPDAGLSPWVYLSYPTSGLLQRDPQNVSCYRIAARASLARYSPQFPLLVAVRQAANLYEKVVEYYPTNPYDHVWLAEIHELLFEDTGEITALAHAIRELETALELDSRRDPNEVRRFSTEKVARLEEKLAQLKKLQDGLQGE